MCPYERRSTLDDYLIQRLPHAAVAHTKSTSDVRELSIASRLAELTEHKEWKEYVAMCVSTHGLHFGTVNLNIIYAGLNVCVPCVSTEDKQRWAIGLLLRFRPGISVAVSSAVLSHGTHDLDDFSRIRKNCKEICAFCIE